MYNSHLIFLAAMSSSSSDNVTQSVRPFVHPFARPFARPSVRPSVTFFYFKYKSLVDHALCT